MEDDLTENTQRLGHNVYYGVIGSTQPHYADFWEAKITQTQWKIFRSSLRLGRQFL